ncbi:TPA: hypothetical protein ACGOVP_000558 [Streptococcus suis]|jgi:hypothetical protein|nr:hypothetical protein [Streptococcus parasuis]
MGTGPEVGLGQFYRELRRSRLVKQKGCRQRRFYSSPAITF